MVPSDTLRPTRSPARTLSLRLLSVFGIAFSFGMLVTAFVVGIDPAPVLAGSFRPGLLTFFCATLVVMGLIIVASGSRVETRVSTVAYVVVTALSFAAIAASLGLAWRTDAASGNPWDRGLVQVAAAGAAVLLLFLTAKLLYGRRIAYIALVIGFILIGLNARLGAGEGSAVPVVVPALLTYVSLQFVRVRRQVLRILLAALFGLVGAFGGAIDPVLLFAPAALLVIGGILVTARVRRRSWRVVRAYGASIAAVSVVFAASFGALMAYDPFPVEASDNGSSWSDTSLNGSPLARYRLIMSDATFSAVVPGSDLAFVVVNAAQVVWLAVLMLIGLQTVLLFMRESSRANPYMFALRLMVSAALVYAAACGAGSSRLLPYVPVLIVLAVYALSWYQRGRVDTHAAD